MATDRTDYYVYMYIDPRNNQEFYYGKGRGKRKFSHLKGTSDTEKTKRIKQIRKEGLDPIIKVIAAGLTEDEALLIETTLLWKLGRFTDNITAGNRSRKFRPQDSLHINIPGFYFNNEIYRFNAGEHKEGNKPGRRWEDYYKYNFICAGGGEKYIAHMKILEKGDMVVVYLTGKGFVGIGKIRAKAVPAKDFKVRGKSILDINTIGSYDRNVNQPNKCQYIAGLKWIKKLERDKAIKASGKGFNLRGSLVTMSKNTKMIGFINSRFSADLYALVRK